MNIRQKTIENYMGLLKDLSDLNGKKIRSVSLCIDHRVPTNTLKTVERLGYITSTSKGVYKVNVAEFQPIHARKIVEEQRKAAYSVSPPPCSKNGRGKGDRVPEVSGLQNSKARN